MPRKKNRVRKPRGNVHPTVTSKKHLKPHLKAPGVTSGKFHEYEEFVENLEEMILLIDRDYRIVMANRAYLRHRGAERKEIIGRLAAELLSDGVFENVLRPKLDECLQGQVVRFEMKYTYSHLGERNLLVSYFPISGPAGVERVACVFEDVTERKQADAAVRQERDRAQRYLDIADVILVALDLEGRITLINRKGCMILGREERELLGSDWVDTCIPVTVRNTVRSRYQSLLAGNLAYVESPIVSRSGEERMIGWHNILLRDDEGRVTGTLRSGEDITERQRAESHLRRLSGHLLHVQDDERRRLARELHDGIGTYLSGMSLALGKIRTFLNETDPAHRTVVEECKELIQIASGEIRSISYLLHPPTLEDLGLESALEWLVKGFSSRSGIAISLNMDKGLGRFKPEIELTLFRVAQEALNNVYRHSGSGTATVRLFRKDSNVVVEISDCGKGMPSSALDSTPFPTVGISGMRERVTDAGGTFGIGSVPGGGCVVRATLPVSLQCQAS